MITCRRRSAVVSFLVLSALYCVAHAELHLVGVPGDATLDCGDAVPAATSVSATGTCVVAATYHWPLNDNSGSSTLVELQAGNHATLTGPGGSNMATTLRSVAGKVGDAIRFDGTNDNASSAGNTGITGAAPRAISFWARTTHNGSGFFTAMGSDTNGRAFGAYLNAAGQLVFWGSNQDINSGVNVRDGNWHHVVVMYDGTNGITWIDGIKRSQTARSLNTTASPMFFASKPNGGERLPVDLDNVMLYDRVLSSNDIATLYADGAGTENSALSSAVIQLAQTTNGICPATITRTWSATDTCGNATSAAQVITINPPPGLALLGVPEATSVGCGDPLPAATVTATGGCGTGWSGLIGRWPLNEATTSSVVLDVDAANPATLHGSGGAQDHTATHSVPGQFEAALSFDGTSTWISTDYPVALTGRAPRSLAFWMASTSTTHGFIVTLGADPAWPQGRGFGAYLASSGRLHFWGSNQDFDSGISVRNGAWRHVVVTYDGTTGVAYVDGQFAGSKAVHLDTPSAPLNIGAKPGGFEKFAGRVDQVVLFGRVLNLSEVQSLYAAQGEDQGPGALVEAAIVTSNTCPGTIYRIWTATDACGALVSATQTIAVAEPYGLGFSGIPGGTSLTCEAAAVVPSVTVTGGCSVAREGLLGHWPLNDDTNTAVVLDRRGAYHGTFSNGDVPQDTQVQAVAGRFGGALRFDGSNDVVATTTIQPVGGRAPRSLSFWMRSTSLHHGYMVAMGLDPARPTGQGFGAYMSAQGRVVFWGSNQDFDSGAFVRDGAWHHVVVVYDGVQGRVYVDGMLKAAQAVALDAPVRMLVLGAKPQYSECFEGDLDNVMLFDRALESNDVAELFAAVSETDGGGATLQYTEQVGGVCPKVLTRIWSAADDCGTSIAATQVVTLVDIEPPVLVNKPADLTLGCGDVPPAAVVTAADACDGAVTVEFTEATNGLGGGSLDLVRTWYAEDACGNGTAWTQVIHVTASGLPTLLGVPGDVSVPCGATPVLADVTATSCCAGSVSAANLLLRLPFDAMEPSVVLDQSGQGNHAVNVDVEYDAQGRIGGAFRFGGSSDYLEVTNGAAFAFGASNSLSISAWLRVDGVSSGGANAATIIAKDDGLAGFWRLELTDVAGGVVTFQAGRRGGGMTDATAAVPGFEAGAWVHLCVVRDVQEDQVHVYADGKLIRTVTDDAGPEWTTTAGPLRVGNWFWSPPDTALNGLLDELRVYGRALTDSEARQLAAAGGLAPVSVTQVSQPGCPALVRRIWTAVDGCGNEVSATQTITLVDQEPPRLSVPRDYTVACGSSIDPDVTGTASATDDCAAVVSVTHIDSPVAPTGCPSHIERTWRATDGCGNIAEGVQWIAMLAGTADADGDGLSDEQEEALGTDPQTPDTDADGLTDWEEVTGQDDSSTPASTCGYVTDPLHPDTDHDGHPDGVECGQGTDPTVNEDFYVDATVEHIKHDIIVCWQSQTSLSYSIVTKTDLSNPVFESILASNIPATPPMNCYTVPVNQSHFQVIRVRIER
jgi:hypothetical protein